MRTKNSEVDIDAVVQDESTDKEKKAPKKAEPVVKAKKSGFVDVESVNLEKKFKKTENGKAVRDEDGNAVFDLIEKDSVKKVRIPAEHLIAHKEQEANTLKRYKEV